MLRLIEAYGEQITTVDEQPLACPALVEDDEGIRWMLVGDGDILPGDWARAAAAGVVGVVAVKSDGYLVVSAEEFIEHRGERMGYLVLRDDRSRLPVFPTLTDLEPPAPEPAKEGTFVHLHLHTEYSALDGVSNLAEVMEAVTSAGQTAVAVTDHGTCSGHPDLQKMSDKYALRPIFGIEAYFVEDRLERPAEGDKEAVERLRDYWHLILWAKDDEGLKNLWAMSTESFRDGLYSGGRGKPKPRMDWETLRKYAKGVMCSTGCLHGPLSHHALQEGDEEVARANLGRLMDIFGDDLYVEIQTTHVPDQLVVNRGLVKLAREYGVPMVAAGDSHYPVKADKHAHQVWLAAAIGKDISAESSMFEGGHDYHIMTEAEVRDALSYLPQDVVDEAVSNTVKVAAKCTATIKPISEKPVFSKEGGHAADAALLRQMCEDNWHKTHGKRESQEVYRARFEVEIEMIIDKDFAGYFEQVGDYCRWARSRKILVGAGRGSGVGSLVAYLIGIQSVDPVEAKLLFGRFMTPGRTSLPDFDVDFPASKKRDMQGYVRQRYGEENVAIVGSTIRLKNKGVVDKLGKALRSTLPPEAYEELTRVSKLIGEAEAGTAGLGLSWDDLWDQIGEDLQPYREKYPELFSLADRMVMRVASYGQHAAGMIISAGGDLIRQLPLRRNDEDGELITQYDMAALDWLGFTKFDMLTLDTLDVLQYTVDLIRKRRGVDIDFYAWEVEYEDPQVWQEIADGHTLGMFQIETSSGTRLAKRLKPRNLFEMSDLGALVRPGPSRSGLTDAYLRRRDGEEEVNYPDPRLAEVLADTYGVLVYQEQVMAVCKLLGGYDDDEADQVRKILGKKKVELVAAAGQEFLRRVVERGMERHAAEVLWGQMSEFAKYAFGNGHSYAYGIMTYWTGWMKIHYPIEMLTSVLTKKAEADKLDRIPDFVEEARRLGYKILPPDVNESGAGFTDTQLAIRYGLSAIKGVGPAATDAVLQGQPYSSFEDFLDRKGDKANAGVVSTLARVGALDSLVPNRRGLEEMLAKKKSGDLSWCANKAPRLDGVPASSMAYCNYDWDSEPRQPARTPGKFLKQKPAPKTCTRACRQYAEPELFQISSVRPYEDADVRKIEMQEFGVHLSSSAFDQIEPTQRQALLAEAELLMRKDTPQGVYLAAGVVARVHPITTKRGDAMAFLGLKTEAGLLDCAVFTDQWAQYQRDLEKGALLVAEVQRTERGHSLLNCMPID